jgi:threonine/homoserine/homoserine lactone efflux protein
MDLNLYLAFVLATSILMLIPGPNVALIVANSVTFGTRYGLLTVLGTSTAMVVQLGLFALGMTALLGVMAQWFEWIRWIGVAYLLWIGVQQWRAVAVDLTKARPERKPARDIFLRGALVSMTNPKTLVFYGAFFPQFVTAGADLGRQILLLSLTFVVLAVLLDGAWAVLAGRLRGVLATHGRLRNRITGGLLMGAGAGLALARLK